MSEKYEHLSLNLFEKSYEREHGKPPRLKKRPGKEKKKYYDVKKVEFSNLQNTLDEEKDKYGKYIDPKQIFKLEVTQSFDPNVLTEKLDSNEIRVLSPSPDKKGLWVVIADGFDKFEKRLKAYSDETSQYDYINAIGKLIDIPPEDKMGELLKSNPIDSNETVYVDVEIWRMKDDDIESFINGNGAKKGIEQMIKDEGGTISDRLTTENFCLLRVKANKTIIDKLLELKEVCLIDRLPKPYLYSGILNESTDSFDIVQNLNEKSAEIAIFDTGVVANHPLLSGVVAEEVAFEDDKVGSLSHGTSVAGIALYGDLKKCIEDGVFKQEVRLISIKIASEIVNHSGARVKSEAVFPEERLLESYINDAVDYIVKQYPNCRVINMSIGNPTKIMVNKKRQFNIASLIDELSNKYSLIFVIAVGNYNEFDRVGFPQNYPEYFFKDYDINKGINEKVKLIEPSTAALGLTVGAITQNYDNLTGLVDNSEMFIGYSPAKTHFPSPFTRMGPGFKEMIKPELVEEGGNVIRTPRAPNQDAITGMVLSLRSSFVQDAKLFKASVGTSLAAPKVAHYVAMLCNKYPDYSSNMIKALLFSSAEIPAEKPKTLNETKFNNNSKLEILHGFYGYGKPSIEKALYSTSQNILLLKENRILLDSVHIYSLFLPQEFLAIKEKSIEVTLVYDPPVNKNRYDYFGCNLEFHLFKNVTPDELAVCFGKIKHDTTNETEISAHLKAKKIELFPKSQMRGRGVHQKGTRKLARIRDVDLNKPLTIAVVSKDRWIKRKNPEYNQDYALIATLKHSSGINLYNLIRQRNRQPAVRVRVRKQG